MILMPSRRVFLTSASMIGIGGLVSLSGKAMAFGLDSLTGGGSGEGKVFTKYVAYGTRSLLLSLSEMHLAVENKESADQLIAVANELKSGEMSTDNWTMSTKTIIWGTVIFSISRWADTAITSAVRRLSETIPTGK